MQRAVFCLHQEKGEKLNRYLGDTMTELAVEGNSAMLPNPALRIQSTSKKAPAPC